MTIDELIALLDGIRSTKGGGTEVWITSTQNGLSGKIDFIDHTNNDVALVTRNMKYDSFFHE